MIKPHICTVTAHSNIRDGWEGFYLEQRPRVGQDDLYLGQKPNRDAADWGWDRGQNHAPLSSFSFSHPPFSFPSHFFPSSLYMGFEFEFNEWSISRDQGLFSSERREGLPGAARARIRGRRNGGTRACLNQPLHSILSVWSMTRKDFPLQGRCQSSEIMSEKTWKPWVLWGYPGHSFPFRFPLKAILCRLKNRGKIWWWSLTQVWGSPLLGALCPTQVLQLKLKASWFLLPSQSSWFAFPVPGISLSFIVSHIFYRGENGGRKRSSGKSGEDQNEAQRPTPSALPSLQIVRKL